MHAVPEQMAEGSPAMVDNARLNPPDPLTPAIGALFAHSRYSQQLNPLLRGVNNDRILRLAAGFTDSRTDTAWTGRFSAFRKYRPPPGICPPTEFSPA